MLSRTALICLCLLLSAQTLALAQVSGDPLFCDTTMSGKPIVLDARIDEIFDFVRSLDPKLMAFEKIPAWEDFDALQKNLEKLKALKTDLASRGELDQVTAMAKAVSEEVKSDEKIKAILDAVKTTLPPQVYLPTQYDLSRLYEELLYSFNKELPRELRLPIKRLPFDQRRPLLLAKGRALLKEQEARFTAQFSSTGMKSYTALRKGLASFEDTSDLMRLLDQERVEFAMNRPEGARWWTPKVGFQNQHISGSSKGSYSPDFRDHIEAELLGKPYSEYATYDGELKPQYGYLKPLPQSGLTQSAAADHYGDDIYIFKKTHVKDRMTWTSGDSFGTQEYMSETTEPNPVSYTWKGYFIPWADRDLLAVDLLNQYGNKEGFEASLGEADISKDSEFLKLKSPTPPPRPTIVQPSAPITPAFTEPGPPMPSYTADMTDDAWKKIMDTYTSSDAYKTYLADYTAFTKSDVYVKYTKDVAAYTASQPYLDYLAQIAQFKLTPEYQTYETARKVYDQAVLEIQGRANAKAFDGTPMAGFRAYQGSGYVELQYFGPLTLDDVEVFEFKKTPPSGDFLTELKKRNITIRDGRVQPAVLWKETPPAPKSP